MATDIEKLVVQLNADIRSYQRDLLKAQGVTNQQARAIERRFSDMNSRLDRVGKSAANSIVAPLAGISAALTTAEVLKYTDAWTSAKNSLAVAGVIGKNQADVLDRLFKSAQANATPIGALTDLYGKAAQASDNLGASQEDLLKFSDGVAVSLKVAGASAESASGALTQLGQLLGSARVQAEEFNSVNDGARPILIAVAKGLDAAGGSVNKLKQIVNAGELSGKQFFEAFLRGLPAIQSMAANSTQTIAQGYTKVNNALTKFVGQTDEGLGASQRLVQGLNALADNFDEVADVTLKVAAIIAGALVGRSLIGMISKLGLGTAALLRFSKAIRAATTVAETGIALRGLTAAAGPVGLVIGAAVTAITLFATSSSEASEAADTWAAALDNVGKTADSTTESVKKLNAEREKDQSQKIQNSIDFGADEIDKTKAALDRLFDTLGSLGDDRISADIKKQVATLKDGLYDGSTAASEVKRQLDDLGKSNEWIRGLLSDFDGLLDRFGLMAKAIKTLKDEAAAASLSTNLNPSHPSGDTVFTDTKKRQDFIDQRNAEAAQTEMEKQIDTRSKAIIDAAAKLGVTLTEAAAKIQAKSEIAAEGLVKTNSAAVSSAAELIKGFESFRSGAYFDVNHYRAGFGSDTVTMPDNSVKPVTANTVVTLADADRDLLRRIGEFQAGIQDKIGADAFNSMNSSQQAALTSIAYNYGSLPDRIVQAIKTGDSGTVYQAIKALGTDNGGINQGRRDQEASLYLNGAPDAVTKRVSSQEDFAKSMKEQQQQLAALKEEAGLRATLNPLLNDYGAKLTTLQKAQEYFTQAQQEGTAAGKELTSAQQLLNGDLSQLSPEAQKQALAMRALATEYGNTTAASNQLAESQEKLKAQATDFANAAKDVVGGALTDIRSAMEDGKITAKEWGDILVGVLNKIADKVQDLLLDQLFKPSSFSWLTAIIGGGTPGGSTGSSASQQSPVNLQQQITPPDQISKGQKIDLSGMRQQRVPVDVDARVYMDEDGNWQARVEKIATGVSTKTGKAGLEQYRRGQFRRDVEKHLGSRKVVGTI